MTEQELFEQVFRYQISTDYVDDFEVLKKPAAKVPVVYEDFLNWMERIRMYSCYTDADLFRPQLEPFQNKVTWHEKYDILALPLRGLGVFECLHPDTPDCNRSYIQMRIGKILSVTLDVMKTQSVANAVLYKQESDKIHPFTNLVCAHQLLNIPMRTIYCLKRTNTLNKPIQDAREITTLRELVNNYENMPIGFLENDYMQMYCEHNNYWGLDPNGYIKQPNFDVEHFVKSIQTTTGITVKLASGNTYTIPNTHDITILEEYNENINQRK